MGLKKTVRTFYLVYTIYTFMLMMISDYKLTYALFGLIPIWSVYLFFAAGYQSAKRVSTENGEYTLRGSKFPFSNILDWKAYQYILCDVLCWISTIQAGRFYTGRNFVRVITGMFNGENAYSIYQSYAKIVNRSFSMTKVPYILMLTFLTVMLIWSATGIIIPTKKKRLIQIIHVFSVFVAYMYFGVARGTNFETYIAFVTITYCILNRVKPNQKNHSNKPIVMVAALGASMIGAFRIVVEARGYKFVNNLCAEIHYLPDRFISKTFPAFTNILTSVFRYLGWGTFTIGVFKYDIVLGSFKGILASLIPLGFRLFFNNNLPDIMRETVSVGVGWVPDYMTFIDYFGIILFFAIVFSLGRLGAWLHYADNMPSLLGDVAGLLIFIEMLSIPVGNFLFVSTPNMLTVFAVLIWYFYEKLNTHRRRI